MTNNLLFKKTKKVAAAAKMSNEVHLTKVVPTNATSLLKCLHLLSLSFTTLTESVNKQHTTASYQQENGASLWH